MSEQNGKRVLIGGLGKAFVKVIARIMCRVGYTVSWMWLCDTRSKKAGR